MFYIYSYDCKKCNSEVFFETDVKTTVRPKCRGCGRKLELIGTEKIDSRSKKSK